MEKHAVFMVPDLKGADTVIIVEVRLDSPDGSCTRSVWRRVGTLNDDGRIEESRSGSCLDPQCDEGLENDQEVEVPTSHDEKPTSIVSCRWAKFAEKKRRQQERSRLMLASKYATGRVPNEQLRMVDTGTQTTASFDLASVHSMLAKSCNASQLGTKLTLGGALILNSLNNLTRKVPAYDDVIYDLALLLYLSSNKTYKILRQVLHLPAVSSLHRKYRKQLDATKKQLINLHHVTKTVSKLQADISDLEHKGLTVNPNFTLAIDAFCFRSFAGPSLGSRNGGVVIVEQDEVVFNHGFVFLLIPHDYRLPVKMAHLAAATSGAYNTEIAQIAESIHQVCQKSDLRVWLRATDGDPGTNSTHETFFNTHLRNKGANFAHLVEDIHDKLTMDKSLWIPITDPLHVMKNMRSRLLKYQIQLFAFSPQVNADELRSALELGPVLNDTSQVGKMRDSYAVSLFTFKNVSHLMKSGRFVAACYLFPFACWIGVIYSQDIDLSLRLFLVELSFQLIRVYFGEFERLKEEGVVPKGSDGHGVTFATPQAAMRILNTLAAFGVALRFGDDNMRMDALGTHLVENAIGIARATSFDPRYERIVTTYTHAEMRKVIAGKLGLTIHIPGRINHGGCKIDPDHQVHGRTLLTTPKMWKLPQIVHLFTVLCHPEIAPAFSGELGAFLEGLDSIAPAVDRYQYHANEAANNGIMARLINFNQ